MLLRPLFVLALSLQAFFVHAETPQLETFLPQDFLTALTRPPDGRSGFGAENMAATDVLRGLYYVYGADALEEQIRTALAQTDGDANAAVAQIVRQATPGAKLAIAHLEAFDLGRQIYIDEAVPRDEMFGAESLFSIARIEAHLAKLQQRYGADTPVAIQRVVAGQRFDETVRLVVNGRVGSADGVLDLANYSTDFVQIYLMNPAFKDEFPQDILATALEYAELAAEEERLAAEGQASRERTAELAAEEERLAAEEERLAAEEERLAAEERAAEQRIEEGFRQLAEKLQRALDGNESQ